MRILVTGAQGCIGAWVVKGLLERGCEVVALDLDDQPVRLRMIAPPELMARAAFRTGRIEDTAAVKSLVKDDGITHVIHLAAQLIPYCQANPVTGAMINVVGTMNVFEAARDAGRPVRVVYASSAAVWGPPEMYPEGKALTEDDPIAPTTHYGVFKQSNEQCAAVFHRTNGIDSVGLRPWTVYGVGRDRGLTSDPTLALDAVARGEKFRIRLTGYMDFQYTEDVAEAFIRCALSDLQGAHVFNLSGELATIAQFQELLAEVEPHSRELVDAEGPQVPVAFRMSAERLHRMIPGVPVTPLREGIRRTLEIFQRERRLVSNA